MKKIDTLVEDIQSVLLGDCEVKEEDAHELGKQLQEMLVRRLTQDHGEPMLRLSNLGSPCRRKLWYSIKTPKLAEKLSASTRLKFLFGDVLELLLLFLARVSGHTVEREQEEVSVNGVKGHIDAVIDGELVDCKSASTYSLNKFRDHSLGTDDGFGYLTQLNSYRSATPNIEPSRAHFLAVDKTLGHVVLDTWEADGKDYSKVVDEVREVLASDIPPPRGYSDEDETTHKNGLKVPTGNKKLGVGCSYCSFKHTCWPGLKVIDYARGPVFFTKLVRPKRLPVTTHD